MNRIRIILAAIVLTTFQLSLTSGQVTITSDNLPVVGDALTFVLANDVQDTSMYKITGENLSWSYQLDGNVSVTENYLPITGTAWESVFPQSNMLIEFNGVLGACEKTQNEIIVHGMIIDTFFGIGLNTARRLNDPFIFRQTPMSYQDSYTDSFSVIFSFPSDIIPGLDTINIPLPGATLDSIRMVLGFEETQTADAYGTLIINGFNHEVLKVRQKSTTETTIEAGLTVFGFFSWFDASQFIDDIDLGLDGDRDVYRFFSPNFKPALLEVTETTGQDSSGNSLQVVNARMSEFVVSGLSEKHILSEKFNMFPNPADATLNFSFETDDLLTASYKIIDIAGKAVQTGEIGLEATISLNGVPQGLYLVELISENRRGYQLLEVSR